MEAKMFNHQEWVDVTNPYILKMFYDERLSTSGFTILGFIEHHFKPVGWTGLWLLAESHFAIHTFPEENKSYIELSSCVEKQFRKFIGE